MKMEYKKGPKRSNRSDHFIKDFDTDSVGKWNNLGKNLNDFWEDLFDDCVE